MKPSTFLAALSLATLPFTALAHENHGQPVHGGVVAEAGEAQFELVAQGDKAVIHVSQHGTPLSTAGATGKLTLLVGTSKTDVDLKPAGNNRLEGQTRLPAGAKALITIQLQGKKPLSARTAIK